MSSVFTTTSSQSTYKQSNMQWESDEEALSIETPTFAVLPPESDDSTAWGDKKPAAKPRPHSSPPLTWESSRADRKPAAKSHYSASRKHHGHHNARLSAPASMARNDQLIRDDDFPHDSMYAPTSSDGLPSKRPPTIAILPPIEGEVVASDEEQPQPEASRNVGESSYKNTTRRWVKIAAIVVLLAAVVGAAIAVGVVVSNRSSETNDNNDPADSIEAKPPDASDSPTQINETSSPTGGDTTEPPQNSEGGIDPGDIKPPVQGDTAEPPDDGDPQGDQTTAERPSFDELKDLFLRRSPNMANALQNSNSPQSRGIMWLVFDAEKNPFSLQDEERLVQRGTLAIFFHSVLAEWEQEGKWLDHNEDECEWDGVDCSDSRVIGLDRGGRYKGGKIPPELHLLDALEDLRLHSNSLGGPIPTELGLLSQLQWLHLDNNSLSGNVPNELGRLENLQRLRLDNNDLTGRVPEQVCRLTTEGSLNELSADCAPTQEFQGAQIECTCDCICYSDGGF